MRKDASWLENRLDKTAPSGLKASFTLFLPMVMRLTIVTELSPQRPTSEFG